LQTPGVLLEIEQVMVAADDIGVDPTVVSAGAILITATPIAYSDRGKTSTSESVRSTISHRHGVIAERQRL
jgi:hypothetical protein